MKRLALLLIWPPLVFLTLILSVSLLTHLDSQKQTVIKDYPILNYTPFQKILGAKTVKEKQQPTVDIIENYFKVYNSPMQGSAKSLVAAAESYGINPFLLVSIAQCESNLGKKSYQDCYNPFGIGIHSQGRLCFVDWGTSYFKMARTLKENYFRYGLDTPEKIMPKYCPQSLEKGGSWAKCVNRFLKELENTASNTL